MRLREFDLRLKYHNSKLDPVIAYDSDGNSRVVSAKEALRALPRQL